MKRFVKAAGTACLLLVLCLALAGCTAIGEAVYGLLGGGADSTELSSASVAPPATSSSQSAESPQPSSSQPAVPEPDPQPTLALAPEVTAFIGQTNAGVKQANGTVCGAYIMYGGSPVADYTGENVPYPFAFWLMDDGSLMDVWAEKSDGAGHAPRENFWPDGYTVDMLETWDEGIGAVFSTSGPVTYTMLAEVYGEQPALEYTAADMGVDYSYSIDTWACEYGNIGGFKMYAVFTQNGGDYELYILRLYK